ncbi:MAG: hypothetical protein E6H66_25245, partial [Betaproteobacteria bacterium]
MSFRGGNEYHAVRDVGHRVVDRQHRSSGAPSAGHPCLYRAGHPFKRDRRLRSGNRRPLVVHQATKPMNPASTMKLLTTFAGLELLGPDYRWRTEVYADGPMSSGVLAGNLMLKGYGDPKITVEQFQELIERLRATGLTTIRGDLVLDRSYFAAAKHDPAAFDGEPLKPYNVGPDALLVNFKSVRFVFSPIAAGDAIDVRTEPALVNVAIRSELLAASGDCGEWRRGLQAMFSDRAGHADAVFA